MTEKASPRWLWPVSVIAGGAALVAAFAVLYGLDPPLYAAILTGWGVVPFRFPFLDTHAVLSALQCAGQGLDTYRVNPCDVLTRAFVYSPLILDAAVFPVAVAWNNGIGIALASAFFLCVASLPAPRGAREWTIMTLATLSTMSVFALERGNIDIAIFGLIILAARLLTGGPTARIMAYLLILFAALLKYYPIVALVAALRERLRRFLSIAVLTAAVLILFAIHYRHGLREAMTRMPTGSYFTDFFGAVNLPFGLATLLSPLTDAIPASKPYLPLLSWLILGLLLLAAAQRAIARLADSAPVSRLPDSERLLLAIGATVMVFCFLAGQSIDYRGIFFLMLLPGLLRLGRMPERRHFLVTASLIVFLMWGELFRQALQHLALANSTAAAVLQTVRAVFWFTRELVWWRVIGTLAGLILCFLGTSDIGASAIARFAPSRRAAR